MGIIIIGTALLLPKSGIIVAGVVFLLVALAALSLKARGTSGATKSSGEEYYLKKSILSPAERSFLGVLESLQLADIRICVKIRFADVLGVKKGLPKGHARSAFNRVAAKHVDFLLVSQSDAAPLLGIELDDSSHSEEARKNRDAFADVVFNASGLPLMHVPARQAYDPRELEEAIHRRLKENSATRSVETVRAKPKHSS